VVAASSNGCGLYVSTEYAEGITPNDALPAGEPRVALLVDYPALLRAIRAVDADAVPRLDDLVRRAAALGPVYVARAYGAWYDLEEANAAFSAADIPLDRVTKCKVLYLGGYMVMPRIVQEELVPVFAAARKPASRSPACAAIAPGVRERARYSSRRRSVEIPAPGPRSQSISRASRPSLAA